MAALAVRSSGERVGLVGLGFVGAGDLAACERGISCDVDLEAAVDCFAVFVFRAAADAGLLADAGEVAVDLAFAGRDGASCSCADAYGDGAGDVLLACAVGVGVLQGFDGEVACARGAYCCCDLGCVEGGADGDATDGAEYS